MDIGGIAFTLVTSIELSSCLYNCVYDIIYIYIQGLHEVLKHQFRQPSKSSDSSFLGVPGASQLPGASERDKAYRKSSSKAQGCRVQRAAPGVCRASRQLEDIRSLSVCLFTVLNSEQDSALNLSHLFRSSKQWILMMILRSWWLRCPNWRTAKGDKVIHQIHQKK